MSYRSAQDIIDAVAAAFDVTRTDMLSDWRSPVVSRPRFAAMHILRTERRLTTPVIARVMCRKDHTTVLNGCKQTERLLETSADFKARYEEAQST